ncbi:MAG TPA: GntR family transcriptional regulator [Nocardioidaceae bacterium]|nr:GntR family transcriptional regulator [Nocardioidaceae bacterium]
MSNNATADGTTARPPVRFQRLAEQVADDLRGRILLGDLADGSELPVEEMLRAEYPVSKPTLREAMRVLEAEGLVTVRRGSIGGAVVHRPAAANVAYTLGLVLASRQVDIGDVGAALREVEPACVAACAERTDRLKVITPVLHDLQQQAHDVVDDLVAVTALSRRFHEAIVELCGNESLSILAGALESLWSTHESEWAHRVVQDITIPVEERLTALADHEQLIRLIEDGDAEKARRFAAQHLQTSQTYPKSHGPSIDSDAVRRSFVSMVDRT